jgi:hypothetical protein
VTSTSPSLHRVHWACSPTSSVLREAPTSDRPSPRASLPSRADDHRLDLVRSVVVGRSHRQPGLVHRVPDPGLQRWRRSDLPGSWRTLCSCAPLSLTPAGPRHQACCGASVLPSLQTTEPAPASRNLSGLHHAAHELPVYASRHESPRAAQHSVPVGGQPLPGRFVLQGSCVKFLRCSSAHRFPLTQALPGALFAVSSQPAIFRERKRVASWPEFGPLVARPRAILGHRGGPSLEERRFISTGRSSPRRPRTV